MNEHEELIWLAGLFEGEGSFLAGPPSKPTQPSAIITMTDEDIIARVAAIFEVNYAQYAPQKDTHKVSYRTRLTGARAVRFMSEIKPFMGIRRQAQIERAIASYASNREPASGKRWALAKLEKTQSKNLSVEVRNIIHQRRLSGESPTKLAGEYQVSRRTIYNC